MQEKIDKIVNILEVVFEAKVNTVETDTMLTAFEIDTYTNLGVNINITLDMDGKNITLEEVKAELDRYVNDFDIDEQIDLHRQDSRYRDIFSIRESLEDFEDYKRWLNKVKYELSHFRDSGLKDVVKSYKIPIVYQSIRYFEVDSDNLQNACKKALKEFFEIPDEYYLGDSFEIDGIIEENYPNESIDYEQLMDKI